MERTRASSATAHATNVAAPNHVAPSSSTPAATTSTAAPAPATASPAPVVMVSRKARTGTASMPTSPTATTVDGGEDTTSHGDSITPATNDVRQPSASETLSHAADRLDHPPQSADAADAAGEPNELPSVAPTSPSSSANANIVEHFVAQADKAGTPSNMSSVVPNGDAVEPVSNVLVHLNETASRDPPSDGATAAVGSSIDLIAHFASSVTVSEPTVTETPATIHPVSSSQPDDVKASSPPMSQPASVETPFTVTVDPAPSVTVSQPTDPAPAAVDADRFNESTPSVPSTIVDSFISSPPSMQAGESAPDASHLLAPIPSTVPSMQSPPSSSTSHLAPSQSPLLSATPVSDMVSPSPSPATSTTVVDDSEPPVSAVALHALRKPKFVGEHELSELVDSMRRSSTIASPSPPIDHLIYRVFECTREDRAHPLGKVRLHQKLELAHSGRGALTEEWREQWLKSTEGFIILLMTQETTPSGILHGRFVFVEWLGEECSPDVSALVQELSVQVERHLRKMIPIALTIQATHPAQVSAEAFAEDLNGDDSDECGSEQD